MPGLEEFRADRSRRQRERRELLHEAAGLVRSWGESLADDVSDDIVSAYVLIAYNLDGEADR